MNHRQSRGYLYRHIAGRHRRALMKRLSARDVAIHDPIVTQLRQTIKSAFIT